MSDQLFEGLADVFQELARCIVGLGPYQEDAVLCGGMVPVIYRRVLPRVSAKLQPLTTFDLDWTLPEQLINRGESLHDRMLKSGFKPVRSGSGRLPVTHYVPDQGPVTAQSPIYIEFLTPREGSQRNRKGTHQGVVEVQPGLHAQTDPYLSLLLAERLNFEALKIPELGLSANHKLSLPHPTCFILQKALIRQRREKSKQDNDACHIYDVAILTREMWPEMRNVLGRLAEGTRFPSKWFTTGHQVLSSMFASATSDGALAVAKNFSGLVSEDEASRGMAAFMSECWSTAT